MDTISMTCRTCKKVHRVKRDKDAPPKAIYMACNWCPDCQDKAKDYYKEWYVYPRKAKKPENKEQNLKLTI